MPNPTANSVADSGLKLPALLLPSVKRIIIFDFVVWSLSLLRLTAMASPTAVPSPTMPIRTQLKNTLKSFLSWVRIGIVGEGTAVGDAIAVSLKRLKDQTTKSKIIILLTDGRSNAGSLSPESATELAVGLGIRIYTIGVGSNGPVPYIEQTPFGPKRIFAKLDLDEDLLKSIAEKTGGRYFRASDTHELKEVYSVIDQLEKTEIKTKEYNDYFELYRWFVMSSILFFIVEIILTNWVCFSIP